MAVIPAGSDIRRTCVGFLFRVRQCAVSHSLSAATHLFLEPYPILGRQCLSLMVFLGERGKGKWLLQTREHEEGSGMGMPGQVGRFP